MTTPPEPTQDQTLHIDEERNVSMSIKLLRRILWGVGAGAFVAGGVLYQTVSIKESTQDIKKQLQTFNQRIDDHEKRLIRIESKTGIARVHENAQGWGR